MKEKKLSVPSTDYNIYLDRLPPEKDVLQNPEGYRLLMLFPNDPMDMPDGTLFEHQAWLYSDKEWLFYEDQSGEMVRTPNVPENQPGKWQKDVLSRDFQALSQLFSHRIDQSQQRLMNMVDRNIPDPETYSREEDKLNEFIAHKETINNTMNLVIRCADALRPMPIDQEAKALLSSVRENTNKRTSQRELQPS